jgi:hypothetical protein
VEGRAGERYEEYDKTDDKVARGSARAVQVSGGGGAIVSQAQSLTPAVLPRGGESFRQKERVIDIAAPLKRYQG